ncbi:hypothetical protein [Arcanobacterium urinimassiliense]|nr:hypothetical protein [Arcanobacterium urinimassiliense]
MLERAGNFNPATFHTLCERIEITPTGEVIVIFKDGTTIPAH